MPVSRRKSPLMWNDPALDGHRETIEAAYSDLGNVRTNTQRSIDMHQQTLDAADAGKALKPKTVEDARDAIALLTHMRDTGVTRDVPMGLDDIADRALAVFGRATEEARTIHALTGRYTNPRGSAWYFDHHSELVGDRPDTGNPNISTDRFSLMSAAVSPSNTPERERAVANSLTELLHPERNHSVTLTKRGVTAVSERLGQPLGLAHGVPHSVLGMSAAQIAAIASHAAEEEGAVKAGSLSDRARSVRSSGPIHGAGLANQRQIESAAALGLGHVDGGDPMDEYDPVSKPKTWAHGNMTAKSVPSSPEDLDYRGIAHHVTYGDPNQGMFMFSMPHADTETPYALRQDVPVAADTWWRGISSGQPLHATREVQVQRGDTMVTKNLPYSPAKRIASDKKDPVAPEHITKKEMGLPDDPAISREGIFHAYINEGIRRAAGRFGDVTFNQHGQPMQMPVSLVHEVGWTQGRAEAGEDPAYNASLRQYNKDVKAQEKAKKASAKFAGEQMSLDL